MRQAVATASSVDSAHPWSDALLPIVIGVTGHRDPRPEDEPRLEQAVAGILRDVATRHPSSPLILLSPLAEGADRLVARVFLGLADTNRRCRLVVPLPMPVAEYAQDFTYDDSRRELDAFLERADVVHIPASPTVTDSGDARSAAYARAGAFIARHAHIMLALWNGVPNEATGGTADVVRFRLEGVPQRYLPHVDLLDAPERGPVHHIVTARSSDGGSTPAAGTVRLLFPAEWPGGDRPESALAEMLEHLESFNADARLFVKHESAQIQRSFTGLIGDAPPSPLGFSASEAHLMRAYAVADALAVHHQRITHRIVRGLAQLAVVALFVNQLYASALNEQRVGLLYLIILLVGAAGLWIANRFNWQQKHFNYRALAEGLRVQFFWRVAGIDASAADSYLRAQREDLHGVRLALRFFELSFDGDTSLSRGDDRLQFVLERWVRSQRRYFLGEPGVFEGAVARDGQRHRHVAIVAEVCFIAALVLLVALVLGHDSLQDVRALLLAASAILLGGAAAVLGYAKVMGYGEHVRHGAKIGKLFLRAEKQMVRAFEQSPHVRSAADDDLVEMVLREIGREALTENAEWVILHRNRPWQFSVS